MLFSFAPLAAWIPVASATFLREGLQSWLATSEVESNRRSLFGFLQKGGHEPDEPEEKVYDAVIVGPVLQVSNWPALSKPADLPIS